MRKRPKISSKEAGNGPCKKLYETSAEGREKEDEQKRGSDERVYRRNCERASIEAIINKEDW